MNNDENKEEEIIECLNMLIKQKQLNPHSHSSTPTPLKKGELEPYLEGAANQHSVSFEKQCTPHETVYIAKHHNYTIRCSIYYRYATYYTRHRVTLT
ncbi:hypothetical protein [Bacillus sp. EB01]|uniref:hypothetical protein n=1 Tax=Bacillus sp. EB01 TaxID=1347086 RepID=UPI000A6BB9CF|nr:hypothetical protein [Bacillus sp. EB01]